MAVLFDTGVDAGTSTTTTLDTNITVASNSGRGMIAWYSPALTQATSVVVQAGGAGESFTFVEIFTSNGYSIETWTLLNPPTGALTIRATWAADNPGGEYGGIISLYQVKPVAAFLENFAGDFDFSGDLDITFASRVGDLGVIAFFADLTNAFTDGANQDRRTTIPSGRSGGTSTKAGASSLQLTVTSTNDNTIGRAFNVMGIPISIPMGARRKVLRPAIFAPGRAR